MRQMNTIVNSIRRTLDLIFVNDEAGDACTMSEAHEPIIEAHPFHPPLLVTLRISLPATFESVATTNDFNFGKIDFVAFKESLHILDWTELDNLADVDLAVDYFDATLNRLFRIHVPVPRLHAKPPWSNSRLHLKRNRSAALRKYTNRRNPVTKHDFCQISNEYRTYSRHLYSCYVRRMQDDLRKNSKRFWSFVNEKRKQAGLPSYMFLGNLTSDNQQTTCDLFERHFSSVFNSTTASTAQVGDAMRNVPENMFDLGSVRFCEADINTGLSKLKNSSSAGPDGIPLIVLKKCAGELCTPLLKICNMSLQQLKFPESWKRSYVLPVFKKGDKCNIEYYRGVTSLCACSKLLEIIVCELLFSKVKSYISMEQHGFISKALHKYKFITVQFLLPPTYGMCCPG
ncbi:uncharacterized protein LOC128736051 [Sabethes cyaneus]|uniref:uncharacterized protein LOC128736051 n=1 Tax=Sabethes cyaneus TaxID=53552 RepID=UPI00237E6D2C|nr:uncharacterized protein LOC128736051 [Sabethes cyaneus]